MSWLDLIKKVLTTAWNNVGTKVPNLSQDTDILNIHCDLVNDSLVDGEESDIIYSFIFKYKRSKAIIQFYSWAKKNYI